MGIHHYGNWWCIYPCEQSDDSVLVQKCLLFLGLRPASISHLPYPSCCCPFFWQHFIGLETDLFLNHGEALDLSLRYSALEIVGEWKGGSKKQA